MKILTNTNIAILSGFVMAILILGCSKESTGPDPDPDPDPTFSISASTVPDGAGTISPAADDTYQAGSTVTLEANSNEGFSFVEWTGDTTSTDQSLSITVDKDYNLTANFEESYPDTSFSIIAMVTPDGAGTISPAANDTYQAGSTVTLEANSNEGFSFVEWTGDTTSTDQSLSILVDKEYNLTANFREINTNFSLAENGITVKCPDADFGATGIVNGVEYTKRKVADITTGNAETTCTSGITNMAGLFQGLTDFNADISSWDVSNVTDMSSMFEKAINFNQDIGAWDVSNVTSMSSMFAGNFRGDKNTFNQDISAWDVSSVTSMDLMFMGTSNFNQPIGNWDVSNVTTMKSMFLKATAFDQDVSAWDVSNVTDMQAMFRIAVAFSNNVANWDVRNVTTMKVMFHKAKNFDHDLSGWCVPNVTNYDNFAAGSGMDPDNDIPDWGTCPEG